LGNLEFGSPFPKIKIVAFRNGRKEQGDPDYRILLSQPFEKNKELNEEAPF